MGGSDKAIGGGLVVVSAVVFTYYTTWAILLPFFDSANPIHSFFPAREWAIRLPAFILVVGLSAIGLFLGSTLAKERSKKAQQARLRVA